MYTSRRIKETGALVAIIIIGTCAAEGETDDSIDQQIRLANTHLNQTHYREAFDEARNVLKHDSNSIEALCLCGIALYKQDSLDNAAAYLKRALKLSSSPTKEHVQALISVVTDKQTYCKTIAAAEALLKKGRYSDAANAYTSAWLLFPMHTETGFEAASTWQRTKSFKKSADILNQIANQTSDPGVIQKCREQLSFMMPLLEKEYLQQAATDYDHQFGEEERRLAKVGEVLDSEASSRARLFEAQEHGKNVEELLKLQSGYSPDERSKAWEAQKLKERDSSQNANTTK